MIISCLEPFLELNMYSKEKLSKTRLTMHLQDGCINATIPFRVVNSPYFQPFLDVIAIDDLGYRGPNFYEALSFFIGKNANNVKKLLKIIIAVGKPQVIQL